MSAARRERDEEMPASPPAPPPPPGIDPALRAEVVAFLREWLPRDAIRTYREMIRDDPEGWHRAPHFASGFVVEHVLRGNGITEKALGVESLEAYWAALLREAVEDGSD